MYLQHTDATDYAEIRSACQDKTERVTWKNKKQKWPPIVLRATSKCNTLKLNGATIVITLSLKIITASNLSNRMILPNHKSKTFENAFPVSRDHYGPSGDPIQKWPMDTSPGEVFSERSRC